MSAFVPFVFPAEAGIHEHGPAEIAPGGVHGSRVKPAMTHHRIHYVAQEA
jgi:hypothetical protein